MTFSHNLIKFLNIFMKTFANEHLLYQFTSLPRCHRWPQLSSSLLDLEAPIRNNLSDLEMSDSPGPGGFLPETGGLPSPAPSSASSTRSSAGLPHPRGKSLQPGSNKEDLVRRFVEGRLMEIARRYVKKFGNREPGDTVVGYKSFSELCKDLSGVVNVLWLSGTPMLQIPFLLRIASDFTQYVRSFLPSPKASFALLRKLDHCFSSLLCGEDFATKETLPGFENGLRGGMTTTDMVRCRSLVEQSRVLMVEVMSSGDADDEDFMTELDADDEMGTDTEGTGASKWDGLLDDGEEERMHLDAARVYENTIVHLNERLGDTLGTTTMTSDTEVCMAKG
ncbi:meiotic recombination protein DMC1 [Thelonectria olida]|uniref:Meiotic recombination protein DMC1 n=1 Tax=Thelonectria olida TaxID=1576542 RepID=A0A9P8WFP5_9HYPO|nr:meiotic recombination protein DMC1 [Thelonectria olida]